MALTALTLLHLIGERQAARLTGRAKLTVMSTTAPTQDATDAPGAVARPINYTTTIVAMVTDDMKTALKAEAKARRVSQGVVAREWLERGRMKV